MGESPQRAPAANSKAIMVIVASLAILIGGIGLSLWLSRTSNQTFQLTTPAPASPVAANHPALPAGPRPTMAPDARSSISLSDVRFDQNGQFDVAEIHFLIIHFDDRWRGMDQNHNITPEPGYPRMDAGLWEIKSQWHVFTGIFNCQQTLKQVDSENFTYDATFTSTAGVPTQCLTMELHLPTGRYGGGQLVADGEPIPLPAAAPAKGQEGLFPGRTVQCLQVATPDGRLIIDGPVEVGVQDNRVYGSQTITIRLNFTPTKGLLKETSLKLKIRHVLEPPSTPNVEVPVQHP